MWQLWNILPCSHERNVKQHSFLSSSSCFITRPGFRLVVIAIYGYGFERIHFRVQSLDGVCRLLYVGVGKKWARWRPNGKSITMDRGTSTMCDVNLSENPQNGSRARANRMYCAQGMYSGGCWRREQENLRPPSIGIMSGTYRPCWLNCNVATSSAAELAPAQIFH